MSKNRNFGQKSKFWSTIEILVKHRNFGQTSQFWSNIEILVKHRNFGQTSKFLSNIKFFVKHQKFGQTSKFWSKIDLFFSQNCCRLDHKLGVLYIQFQSIIKKLPQKSFKKGENHQKRGSLIFL